MDLQELRLSCLKMAYEHGGKPEALLSAANALMDFILKDPAPAVAASEPAPQPVSPEAIAACGTALQMPEGGDLAAGRAGYCPKPHLWPRQSRSRKQRSR